MIPASIKGGEHEKNNRKRFGSYSGSNVCYASGSHPYAKEPYKIGALFAVTGPVSFLGEPEKNTAVMLQEQINKEGGINGHPLEIIIEDTKSDETQAVLSAKKLLENAPDRRRTGREQRCRRAAADPGIAPRAGLRQALLPAYSAIDAYPMVACSIDEAVRRVLAVGGDVEHIGGVDNFCWPNIQHDPVNNPDGKFKAAQLVRACRALRDVCLAYGIPLLSGKDSMYVDGHLAGRYGEMHKVSALETMQFAKISLVPDIRRSVTMDSKRAGDLVYIAGLTRNECGGSEYYAKSNSSKRWVQSMPENIRCSTF